jgi:hypothetical protein
MQSNSQTVRRAHAVFFVVAASVVLSVCAGRASAAVVGHEIRYTTGDAAPGGGTFMSFNAPQIDADGNVAFTGSTAPTNSGVGLWAPSATAPLGLVAKVGVNISANGLSGFAMNPSGQLAFAAETGLWAYDRANGMHTLMQKDGVAPGTGGAQFREVYGGGNSFRSYSVVSPTGQVVFQAPLKLGTGSPVVTEANDHGFWSGPAGSNGATVNLLREGPAPGMPDNWNIWDYASVVRVNGAGQTAVSLAAGTGFHPPSGIWRSSSPGSWQLLAGTGATYDEVSSLAMNGAGDVAFYARLAGSGTPSVRARREATGLTNELARAGQVAPGAGGNFVNFFNPVAAGDGSILFFGDVNGGIGSGLWRADANNNVTLLGLSKQDAPGLPGYKYGNFSGLGGTLAGNDAGDILFGTGITDDPNNPVGSKFALWFHDGDTDLTSYVMGTGLPLPGDGRTVSTFSVVGFGSNNQDGAGSPLNDAGQFAALVEFTDGSDSIVVFNVPEPSAPLLASAAASVSTLRRRRRRRR